MFLWLGLAVLSSLFYLAVARWGFGISGFPLDDAWIHQTYARNLAYTGQLAFVPGVPSAGSTAPLWTILLSLGYLLDIPYKIWTYSLGIIFLGLTGWTLARLGQRLFSKSQQIGLWTGLFCLFEWHLVWAAVSGMETILFIWLSVFLIERYINYQSSPNASPLLPHSPAPLPLFLLGILGGLLTLTRPEGLGLVGLIGLDLARRHVNPSPSQSPNLQSLISQSPNLPISLISQWLLLAFGLSLPLLPYIAFHLWITGSLFPNTFYAKQSEYALILRTIPLWWRLFGNFGSPVESVQGVFRVVFVGPQVLLLPGLFMAAWHTIKMRRFDLILIWAWWISFLVLYAIRLPVTYQHGRYQIPAIAWIILLGLWGTFEMINPRRFLSRVVGRAILTALLILVFSFVVIGAQVYGRDIRIIDSEMVATAKWLADNTPADALIAAHDIGAVGYFAQRPIIDLAGLVTPEVIPIIRDEAALFEFIQARRATYLMTFPSWYPELVENNQLQPLHNTQAPWAPRAGGENMVIYKVEYVK